MLRLPTYVAIAAAALGAGNEHAAAQTSSDDAAARFTEQGADTCLGCHNSASMLEIFRTPHGAATDPDSPMASLQCESCHGPGGQHADRRTVRRDHAAVIEFGRDADTAVTDQDAVCTRCHQNESTRAWTGSEHERNETGCSGCHRIHTPSDPILSRAGQTDVCFDCHRRQRADALKPSAHPLITVAPARVGALVCTDCHNPHGSAAGGLLTRPSINELCFDCHAEYRGPVIFDHAPVSEDCSICHEPHGSIHAPLLTRRAPLLCQSCHSQRGHPSVPFTDQSLPGARPSPMLLGRSCVNCHTQVHGSNHPSGFNLMR
ncbi:MAG TPA: DmsE family decaheme c-type cytochrome [Gammaproteobacteria bacterium]|nr:DmsE family decaheme c-type cytochrome [Gammaproteobacteria bacterium]